MKYKIQKKITASLGLTALMLCVSAQPAFADTKAGQEAMEQTVAEQAADQPAVLTAPNLTKLETAEGDTVSIEWSTVEGADFYRVYRSATKTGGYKLVKTVYDTWAEDQVSAGESYYYKIMPLRRNEDGKLEKGPCSDAQMITKSVGIPVILSVQNSENNGLTVSWERLPEADGYVIYRRAAGDSGYKRVKVAKAADTVWQDTKVEAGTKYYYKMKAYCLTAGAKNYGKVSATKSRWTASAAPGDMTASQDGNGTVTLNWTATKGTTSYRIYRAGADGVYNRIATGVKTCSYTDAELTMGQTYSYQIEAVHGSLISQKSAAVSIAIGAIKVSTRTLYLGPGVSAALSATTELDGTIQWVSADPSIAAVDSDGVVVGVAPGKTLVYATLDGIEVGVTVIVTDAPLNGIDVSKWQQAIDWKTVKASGIRFAMLRLAHGTSKDIQFENYYAGAMEQGIPVGIYCYTLAKSVDEGIAEAEYLLELLDGKELAYPIALDLESDNQIKNMNKAARTQLILEYKRIIEEAGYQFVVYANLNWLNNYIDQSKLAEENVDIWIARYRSQSLGHGYEGGGNVRMWQYSSTGQVDGILDAYGRYINVDLDVCYDGY